MGGRFHSRQPVQRAAVRAFVVLDEWSRASLAIQVDVSLTGERVTRVLERLRGERGLPLVIQADNGPELRVQVLDQWAYEHGVKLQFIAPVNQGLWVTLERGKVAGQSADCSPVLFA